MKAKIALPLIAVVIGTGISTTASADEVLNMVVGTGLGAVVGHAVGGHDGAVVGGVVGAMVGAAASDNERRRGYETRAAYPVTYTRYYEPQPVIVAPPPPAFYTTRVVYSTGPDWQYRRHDAWREHEWRERQWRRHGWREHGDHGRWHDDD
jgi:hypothetical protein